MKIRNNIRLFITDVDGVLTDGKIYYSSNGDIIRAYHMHDGVFFKLKDKGILTAFCSGESDITIENRAKKLGIDHVLMGSKDKLKDISGLLKKLSLSFDQVAYVGDDMGDYEIMKKVGVPFAPNNAVKAIKNIAQYTSKANGGEGAIREIIDTYFI